MFNRIFAAGLAVAMLLTQLPVSTYAADIETTELAQEVVVTGDEAVTSEAVVAEGTCGDNVTWTITSDKVLTIDGTGEISKYNSTTKVPWQKYDSKIDTLVVKSGISGGLQKNVIYTAMSKLKEIVVEEGNQYYSSYDGVLYNKNQTELIRCPKMKTQCPEIPDTVVTIGMHAFDSCARIRTFTFPNSIKYIEDEAFNFCYTITEFSIPDGVLGIGFGAFYNAVALKNINIPASAIDIDPAAFENCESLSSINVDEANKKYSSVDGVWFDKAQTTLIKVPQAMAGVYTIPNTVATIGEYEFSYCKNLSEIIIPDSVIEIESRAFDYCDGLTSITVPGSVKEYADNCYTFSNNANLKEIVFSEGVTKIGKYTVYYGNNLTEVTIPKSVTSINNDAFYSCSNLTTIYGYAGTKAEEFASAKNLKFISLGDAVAEPNGVKVNESTGKYYYYVNGTVDTSKNGLVQDEITNAWVYCENGEWITNKFDFVEFGGGQFFVVNGVLAGDISGLQYFDDKFYFLAYGQLQDYTGLALYDGEFFYVQNGVLAVDYNGLLDFDGSTFLIAAGRIVGDYTGLYNDAVTGKWYYIVYGQVQTAYTGLVMYDGAWFYLVSGVLASDYVGYVEYDGSQFYVANGQVVR